MTDSFVELTNLAIALSTAVDAKLMSFEEARAIWRKELVLRGLKPQPTKLIKVEEPETKSDSQAKGGDK